MFGAVTFFHFTTFDLKKQYIFAAALCIIKKRQMRKGEKKKMIQLYLQLLDTEKEKADFELLYERYRRLMHWVAKGILHDDGLAEDAVHEAFLRVIKNFHKIHEISCPETKNFVVIIVRNIAISLRDKERKHEKELDITGAKVSENADLREDDLHNMLENISYGFDETADELMRKELMRVILSLPNTDREILLLYGYLGYSTAEIAAFLDITDAAAYKRLQRARKLLADSLERGESK